MQRSFLFVAIAGAIACSRPAQPRSIAPASTWLGYCHDVAAPTDDELDRTVLAFMKDEHIPGLQLAIRHRGKTVKDRAYGYASLEACALASTTTIFGIGSLSKQFLAAEIQTLAREGKLSLDDSPAKVLPESGSAWQHVTIRQMLHHASGIRDYAGDDPFHEAIAIDRMQEPATADAVRQLATQPLGYEPGNGWGYSNTAYLLLSIIAERVVGKPLPELMRDRLFHRIGMDHTGYCDPRAVLPEMASGYSLGDDGTLVHGLYRSPFYSTKGDTGMRSTAEDLIRWHEALRGGSVLSASELADATTPMGFDGWQMPYGFGWAVDWIGGRLVMAHSGSFIAGYSAYIIRLPDEDTAIAVVSNQHMADMARIARVILARLEPDLEVSPDAPAARDPDPQRTARALAAFHARDASANTSGWNHFLANSRRLPIVDMLAAIDQLEFLGCTAPTRARFDPAIDHVERCAYRATFAGKRGRVLIGFTPDRRIAYFSPE
jgi:CubicO group peptidase (beta-lactamase class C family)